MTLQMCVTNDPRTSLKEQRENVQLSQGVTFTKSERLICIVVISEKSCLAIFIFKQTHASHEMTCKYLVVDLRLVALAAVDAVDVVEADGMSHYNC